MEKAQPLAIEGTIVHKEVGRDTLSLGARVSSANEEEEELDTDTSYAGAGAMSLQRNHRLRQNRRIQRGISSGSTPCDDPYASGAPPTVDQCVESQPVGGEPTATRVRARRSRQYQQEQEALLYHLQNRWKQPDRGRCRTPEREPSPEFRQSVVGGRTADRCSQQQQQSTTNPVEDGTRVYDQISSGFNNDSSNRQEDIDRF